jgi:1,4-alpha-glucan branching enzyme
MLADASALFGRSLCRTKVRSCVKVREAAAAGLPLASYAPECTAAQDYATLARELLAAERKGVRLATFFLEAPVAERVRLVGDFCDWRLDGAVEMARTNEGRWQAECRLAPGTYHYKYLVDGSWHTDPHNRCREADPFGGTNSLLVVEE